jgi:hypothetical protein
MSVAPVLMDMMMIVVVAEHTGVSVGMGMLV